MANLAWVLLLTGAASGLQNLAVPAPEARVSVAQLEQVMTAGAHTRDSKLAAELAGLELSERTSSARLVQWLAEFRGERTRQALTALADASVFLDPPAAELVADPAPDEASQQQIVSLSADYVTRLRPKLPDFSALRTTTRFEKATRQQMRNQREQLGIATLGREKMSYRALGRAPSRQSDEAVLYFLDVSASRVTYQNDRVRDDENDSLSNPAERRLSTSGEFGAILSVVLGDARQGQISWAHWEVGAHGRLAVFHYAVPKEKSHYAVLYAGSDLPEFPAYHGEIAIDPADGAIYRIAILSEDPSRPDATSGIAVEYGPTVIGGKTYVCPQRSVAVSSAPGLTSSINDVSYTEYHLFRGEARILP